MKKFIFAALTLIAISTSAQDSSYNGVVKFNMTDYSENGITFQRKAFFKAMDYNQEANSIRLQFGVEYYNTAGTKKMKTAREYTAEAYINNGTFVNTATGEFIGSLGQVLLLYGKPSGITPTEQNPNPDPYKRTVDGRYDLTTACMGEFDYLMKGFDSNQKLHNTIKTIGQRLATAGKFDPQ